MYYSAAHLAKVADIGTFIRVQIAHYSRTNRLVFAPKAIYFSRPINQCAIFRVLKDHYLSKYTILQSICMCVPRTNMHITRNIWLLITLSTVKFSVYVADCGRCCFSPWSWHGVWLKKNYGCWSKIPTCIVHTRTSRYTWHLIVWCHVRSGGHWTTLFAVHGHGGCVCAWLSPASAPMILISTNGLTFLFSHLSMHYYSIP